MTTMTTRAKRSRDLLTAEQRSAIYRAHYELKDSGASDSADKLRRLFPSAFAAEAGPLFVAEQEQTSAANIDPALIDTDPTARIERASFPGIDELDELHPRRQACVSVFTAPSRPRSFLHDPTWQLNCLWERWRFRLGEVQYSRWAKLAKPALQLYTFLDLWNAIEAFREARQSSPDRGRFLTVNSLFDALPQYVETGLTPYKNDYGDMTTRGTALFGPAGTSR